MLLLWKGFEPQWFKGLGSYPFHNLLVCDNFIKVTINCWFQILMISTYLKYIKVAATLDANLWIWLFH